MNQRVSIKNIVILQAVVVVYTLSSVVAKFAADKELFSFSFFLFYGLEIVILGIYAVLWQQMIKRFDLSVAYANRAMAILWSAVWAVVLFRDILALKQVIGIAFVVLGTVIVNSEQKHESEKQPHVPGESDEQSHVPEEPDEQPYVPEESDEQSHIPEESDEQPHVSEESDEQPHVPGESDEQPYVPEEPEGQSYVPEESEGQPHIPEELDEQPHVPEESDEQPYVPEESDEQKLVQKEQEGV